jgi:endoglucanase
MRIHLVLILNFLFQFVHAQPELIRINQIGYYPEAPKIAIIINTPDDDEFEIIDENENIVYSGWLGDEIFWEKSGETVRKADFTEFKSTGKYRMKVGAIYSWPFEIRPDIWRQVAVALAKTYYLQRASFELEEEYAGKYFRPAGHPDTACVFHSSTGKSGILKAPGGWYDAGDFGKYIVSAGITLGNMLSIMERIPELYPDGSLNIPESGNGLNDLLDEAKYELDWFKYMQDDDGGVFVKITSEKYPDMMFPHKDPLQRNVYGKSTAATLHFTAVMAMAKRLFENFDRDWSEDCLSRAERAWQWARKNNDEIFRNPPGVLSGAYSNRDMSDEFLWAAAELFLTTGKDIYRQYLTDHKDKFNDMEAPGWANVNGLAITDLAANSHKLPGDLKFAIESSLIHWADSMIHDTNQSAYHIPDFRLVWGSNGFIGSTGLCFVYAYMVTGEQLYLHAAAAIADYLLGKNATGYCFVTGFGSKKVMNLHHSVSIADGIQGSLPSFVPGGPNPSMQDKATSEYGQGAQYESTLPAKAYTDDKLSYASNENDICYSAPVLALIAALDYFYGEPFGNDWEKYYKFPD